MNIRIFGKCVLPHASQIYTGIHELNISGEANVIYEPIRLIEKEFGIAIDKSNFTEGVFAKINSKNVYFDFLDSTNISEKILTRVDFYFKRSYRTQGYSNKKIIPLGLNYEVYSNRPNRFEMARFMALNYKPDSTLKSKISTILDSIGIGYLPREKDFIKKKERPKRRYDVLFLARTWDPNEPNIKLTDAEKENRLKINTERANLIKKLKSELGDKFLGGFSATEHSRKEFPECVIENTIITKKKNYINAVKEIPICIATAGLHCSIGWKFAEYVALNRAIISEKTEILIPYNFSENRNYISFQSETDCLNQVEKLISNDKLRIELMENNKYYYENYLCPKKFVINAISQIHMS